MKGPHHQITPEPLSKLHTHMGMHSKIKTCVSIPTWVSIQALSRTALPHSHSVGRVWERPRRDSSWSWVLQILPKNCTCPQSKQAKSIHNNCYFDAGKYILPSCKPLWGFKLPYTAIIKYLQQIMFLSSKPLPQLSMLWSSSFAIEIAVDLKVNGFFYNILEGLLSNAPKICPFISFSRWC